MKQYHHGDLRTALMSAALSLIEQHGVKGFSLKDAAVQVGVSSAAPYRHFTDKDALLDALRNEAFALFHNSLKAAYERAATPQTRIEELGVAYVMFALHNPARFGIMFSMGGGKKPDVPGAAPSTLPLLVNAVAALTPKTSPKRRQDLVVACWSIVHGFATLQMEGAFAGPEQRQMEKQLRRALRLLNPPVSIIRRPK